MATPCAERLGAHSVLFVQSREQRARVELQAALDMLLAQLDADDLHTAETTLASLDARRHLHCRHGALSLRVDRCRGAEVSVEAPLTWYTVRKSVEECLHENGFRIRYWDGDIKRDILSFHILPAAKEVVAPETSEILPGESA